MFKSISRQQMVDLMKYPGEFTLVDVRDSESYEQEHIKGAISIPLDEIEARADQVLRKEDLIVVYCASFNCMASTKAAEKLITLGFVNVADYKGGMLDYKSVPFALEGRLHEHVGKVNSCNC
jgi:rhodanese-related sulfurtransferase